MDTANKAQVCISLESVQAVIFDMDGTMVKNTADHHAAWNDFLERHGKHFTEEQYRREVHGKNNREILRGIFGADLDEATLTLYAAEKERIYRERFAKHFTSVAGLVPLLEYLEKKKKRLAVATTSCKDNRDFILGGLNIEHYFSVITGDEDVSHGKPDPEIYTLSAQRLGLPPIACLAFEDTPAGIQAARAAGIHVIGVATSHTPEDLSGADFCVQDFNAFLALCTT